MLITLKMTGKITIGLWIVLWNLWIMPVVLSTGGTDVKGKIVLGMLAFLFLFVAAENGNASPAKEKAQVIVLFAEGMSFFDAKQFSRYPHVDKWLKEAGVGALSIRTPGSRTAANAYLLMGSGGQALYTERSGTAFYPEERLSPRETAGERARELGSDSERGNSRPRIIFPGIFRLIADNKDKPYKARIGLLGTQLAEYGVKVASYGNGDFGDTRQRHSILFAMDDHGNVPQGDLAIRSTQPAEGLPFGRKTSYEYLLDKIMTDHSSGLITVQLSDLSLLYQMADDMEPGQFARQYDRVLNEIAMFLGSILSKRNENQTVVLLSPAVNVKASREKTLLPPVMVWQKKGGGLLTSATTRQEGLISGLDVVPSILNWLDVPVPKGLTGHTIRMEKGSGFAQLADRVEHIHHTYATRSSVLYTYVMLQIFTLGGASLLWLWGRKRQGMGLTGLRRGMRLSLLTMLWFPFLLLAEAVLAWRASGAVVLGILIMAALLAGFLQENHTLPGIAAVVCGTTAASLLADGWTGATLMSRSYLGYDPVIGARFYGLGNEYEGVLIGSAIMFVASVYQLCEKKQAGRLGSYAPFIALAVFGSALYYMLAPGLGTDAGGFLAGLIGFSVALARLQGWQIGKKGLLLLTGGLAVGVIALFASSLWTSEPLTHVGRVSQQIVTGNWQEVGQMLERKLAMNIRLIRVSIWSKVFVVSLLVLGLLSLWNDRFLRHLATDYPFLAKGFSGVIAGSLAGLVLNDSGIVTAATCIVFLVVPALYAALTETTDERCST